MSIQTTHNQTFFIMHCTTIGEDIAKIIEDFNTLDDWEEKYSYLIECGKNLKALDPQYKKQKNKVDGCVSQVWLVAFIRRNDPKKIYFQADSDSYIVRGIISVLLKIYSGKTSEEIITLDIHHVFNKLGLNEHLTANRSNGFFSVVSRIRAISSNEYLDSVYYIDE